MYVAYRIISPEKGLFVVSESEPFRTALAERTKHDDRLRSEVRRQLRRIRFAEALNTARRCLPVLGAKRRAPNHQPNWIEIPDVYVETMYAFAGLLKKQQAFISDREGSVIYRSDDIVQATWNVDSSWANMDRGGDRWMAKDSGEVLWEYTTWFS